jgi:DNA-directed RNA polymerase subunit RPC12/RpoP
MPEKTENQAVAEITDALKGAAVALGVIAVIPIFIPTAACVLAFTEIKEKLKRCPRCASRKLIFKGVEDHGSEGCLEIRFDRYKYKRRRLPVHSFFECADCSGRFKKLYGGPLLSASEEEFSKMAINSF